MLAVVIVLDSYLRSLVYLPGGGTFSIAMESFGQTRQKILRWAPDKDKMLVAMLGRTSWDVCLSNTRTRVKVEATDRRIPDYLVCPKYNPYE